MVRTWRAALAVLAWVAWPTAASAGKLQFGFDLDPLGWDATHIVVVTEGDKIDGDVEVLESWRGDIRMGDRLKVPDLAAYAAPDSRAISKFQKLPKGPTHVTGSRMVLFLKGKAKGAETNKVAGMAVCTPDFPRNSIAWIEASEAYAFEEWMSPGCPEIVPLRMTEGKMRERVRELARVRTDLGRALGEPDPSKRISALCPLVGSDVLRASFTAIDALKEYKGDRAVEVGRQMAVMLDGELAFWRQEGPKLPVGWWEGTGLKEDEVQRLWSREWVSFRTLWGMRKIGCPGCREKVAEFRDFWRSLPQLGGDGDDLCKECELILTSSKK